MCAASRVVKWKYSTECAFSSIHLKKKKKSFPGIIYSLHIKSVIQKHSITMRGSKYMYIFFIEKGKLFNSSMEETESE